MVALLVLSPARAVLLTRATNQTEHGRLLSARKGRVSRSLCGAKLRRRCEQSTVTLAEIGQVLGAKRGTVKNQAMRLGFAIPNAPLLKASRKVAYYNQDDEADSPDYYRGRWLAGRINSLDACVQELWQDNLRTV